MHIHNRLPIIALALLALLPVSGLHMTASLMDKHKAAEELDIALEAAERVQNSGSGLLYEKQKAQKKLAEAEEFLVQAQLKKTRARRELVLVQRTIDQLQKTYGIDATNTGALVASVEAEQEKVGSFLRYIHGKRFMLAAGGPDLGVTIAQNLLYTSLGDITDLGIRNRAITYARLRVFKTALLAKQLGEQVQEKEADYDTYLQYYEQAWQQYMAAKGGLDDANARIAEVQRITAEVESQILSLQRELARIDAALVARLERELIEKGLMSAQPGERSDGRIRSKQTFQWPVTGRVSAGFFNAAYKAFFGVAHKGVDIVVPQGTRVSSAADGVVYLARDGGRFGYSYVLVGHRNGYATLYGHLSSITVSTGQEIARGHVVGYSGGTPGTYGAGPMTTGAHLHFEVIKNGAHVDPMTILP